MIVLHTFKRKKYVFQHEGKKSKDLILRQVRLNSVVIRLLEFLLLIAFCCLYAYREVNWHRNEQGNHIKIYY